MKKESDILADVYESVRNLSMRFIAPLKDLDIYTRIEVKNTKFNSAHWILAHLVWTEHFLLNRGLGGEEMEINWLDQYSFGSNPDDVKIKPTFDEIMKRLDEVHERAMQNIKSLSDEQLQEDNKIGASFGGSKSKRTLIIHAIRHEPMHIGQLSWILKTNGLSFA